MMNKSGRQFAGDTFECISLSDLFLIKVSLKSILTGTIDDNLVPSH